MKLSNEKIGREGGVFAAPMIIAVFKSGGSEVRDIVEAHAG